MTPASSTRAPSDVAQIARYVTVGLVSNLAGYLAYLILTWTYVGPKVAMSLVYIVGASVGYLGNRRWTFVHQGKIRATLLKYVLAHLCGYSLNVAILHVFVDQMMFPHQAVQAAAIVVVAGFLFIVFKTIVFADTAPGGRVERLDEK